MGARGRMQQLCVMAAMACKLAASEFITASHALKGLQDHRSVKFVLNVGTQKTECFRQFDLSRNMCSAAARGSSTTAG
jgi:hypothetical protein